LIKLIRLELRKLKWLPLLLWAAAVDIILALWVLGSDLMNNDVRTYDRAFAAIASYVGLTFIVFAGVLMAKLVIDEYRNKTVTVLYAYPIPRHRILTAKLLVIAGWTFLSTSLSNTCIAALFLVLNGNIHYVAGVLPEGRAAEEIVRIVIFAAGASGIAMIPLFFGMLRKTMPAVLVSSFILSNLAISVTNNDESPLYHNVPMLALLSAGWLCLGCVMAFASIRRAAQSDVL
jgi:ABC-type transport system involved in multi-copper enzyme maturation permease subunit